MRALVLAVLAFVPASQDAPVDSTAGPDLRDRVALAVRVGVTAEHWQVLADECLDEAAASTSRRAFWNAIGLAADLCQLSRSTPVRDARARAIELLSQRESDTRRWSSLLSKRFVPSVEGLTPVDCASELAAYDAMLDARRALASSDRVRAELLYAKIWARVFVNLRWDVLGSPARNAALGWIEEIDESYGQLPNPGTGDPTGDTVGRRARAHVYELSRLFFRASAPDTNGIDLDGRPFDLADYRGQVCVIDFWTTFCQPCLALVPGVRVMMERFAGEPVVYVGVNGDTDRLVGRATARRTSMNWRNLWDGPRGTGGPASRAWNVAAIGWPSVFVLDREGRIRFKLRGQPQVEAELEEAIRTLLAE